MHIAKKYTNFLEPDLIVVGSFDNLHILKLREKLSQCPNIVRYILVEIIQPFFYFVVLE